MAWLGRWRDRCVRLVESLVFLSFVIMGMAILTQICMRTAGHAFLAMEDISFFGLFWLVFTGMAVAFRQKTHVTVDIVVSYLPAKAQWLTNVCAEALVLAFLVLFTWSGVRLTLDNVQQYAMQLRISVAYIYFILPVGGFVSALVVLHDLLEMVVRPPGARPVGGRP